MYHEIILVIAVVGVAWSEARQIHDLLKPRRDRAELAKRKAELIAFCREQGIIFGYFMTFSTLPPADESRPVRNKLACELL